MYHPILSKNRDRLLLGSGVAAGLLAGILLKQRAGASPRLPKAAVWQKALAGDRGERQAALLIARAQRRFAELYDSRPLFNHPALRMHLEQNILPGLALYQTLCEALGDREAALALFDQALAADVEQAGQNKLLALIQYVPDPFSLLRRGNRWTLEREFPASGWDIRWLEDSPDCIAYNIHDCFYHNILNTYKAPELTAHFCKLDDASFGNLPFASWERTQTIGRGDEFCNFRFRRIPARTPA